MTKATSKNGIYKRLFLALFIFVTGCFAWLYISDPYTGDDLGFLSPFDKAWNAKNSDNYFENHVTAIANTIHTSYTSDVSRLSNFIGVLLLSFPGWISSIIFAICFAFSLWFSTLVTGIKTSDLFKFCILTFLLIFGVFWEDTMFSIMYAYNYTCTTMLMLWCIWLFQREKQSKLWKVALLGIVTGAWHESFTVVLLAGGIFTLFVHKSMIRRDRVTLLTGIAIGSVLIFSSPAFHTRTGGASIYGSIGGLMYYVPYFAVAAAWCIGMCRKQWRPIVLQPIVLIALASGGLILTYLLSGLIHAAFPTMILSCLAISAIINQSFDKAFHNNKKYVILPAAICGLLVIVHLSAVSAVAYNFRRECSETQRILDLNRRLEQRRSIFVPITYRHETTPLALTRPVKFGYLPFSGTYESLCLFYVGNIGTPNNPAPIYLIPQKLESFTTSLGKKIASQSNVWLYAGYLVTDNFTLGNNETVDITFSKHKATTDAYIMPFTTLDGHVFYYILPVRPSMSHFWGNPTAIEFVKKN